MKQWESPHRNIGWPILLSLSNPRAHYAGAEPVPCIEMPLLLLKDKVRNGVIKPAADVPELQVADKDLAIHVQTVS
jgi:hypothetical protein